MPELTALDSEIQICILATKAFRTRQRCIQMASMTQDEAVLWVRTRLDYEALINALHARRATDARSLVGDPGAEGPEGRHAAPSARGAHDAGDLAAEQLGDGARVHVGAAS
jgi:hypothetical protein